MRRFGKDQIVFRSYLHIASFRMVTVGTKLCEKIPVVKILDSCQIIRSAEIAFRYILEDDFQKRKTVCL